MLENIIRLSIRQRWTVIVVALLIAGLGIYNFGRLKIDAVPDITNVQVQVNTAAPGFSPWRPNSASPCRSKPRWPVCRASTTRVPFRALA